MFLVSESVNLLPYYVLGTRVIGFARWEPYAGGYVSLANACWGYGVGNIVIIGVLVAAYVGYSAYTQKNRGGGITGGKKRA